MKITGKIYHLSDTVVKNEKFKFREIGIETIEQYPQRAIIQFSNDKADWLDKYKIGQIVDVDFNLKAREYNGKHYNSIEGWKITSQTSATTNAETEDDLPY